jgi:VCBS repeat-containing protein
LLPVVLLARRAAHVVGRDTDAAGGEVATQVTTARGARGTATVNADGSFSFRAKVGNRH